jgi:hypothetical protein
MLSQANSIKHYHGTLDGLDVLSMIPEYTQFDEMGVSFNALDKESDPMTPLPGGLLTNGIYTEQFFVSLDLSAYVDWLGFVLVPMVVLSFAVRLVWSYPNNVTNDISNKRWLKK